MVVSQFIVLFSIIGILVWVLVYGMSLSRKAKSDTDKKFISRYFVILVITFAAGGITRTIQQSTGAEWLNGFVPIFGGLFLALMGIPFVWLNNQNNFNRLTRFLFFLLGSFILFLGLVTIYLGIT